MNYREYRAQGKRYISLARALGWGKLQRHFQALVAADPSDAGAVLGLVWCIRASAGDEARALLERLVRERPGCATCWCELGFHLGFFDNEYEEALGCYRRAVELDPVFFDAHLLIAWLGISKPPGAVYLPMEEALFHARAATQADPDRPEGWLALGDANAELGRTDEAIEAWERSLAIPLSHILEDAVDVARERASAEESRRAVRERIENVRRGLHYSLGDPRS